MKHLELNLEEIERNEEFMLKDESKWNEIVELNGSDVYSGAILSYAIRWAKAMQYCNRNENMTIAESADATKSVCNKEGMSMNSFCGAVSVLVSCWKFGDELNEWVIDKYHINCQEIEETENNNFEEEEQNF